MNRTKAIGIYAVALFLILSPVAFGQMMDGGMRDGGMMEDERMDMKDMDHDRMEMQEMDRDRMEMMDELVCRGSKRGFLDRRSPGG